MKNKTLLFLVAIGIVIRLLIIFDQKEIIKLPDSELYLSLAKDYYQGNFHPDLVRTPGYPLFLYLVFFLFGWGKLKIIFIIQHFLTLFSCVLIYKVLEKKIRRRVLLLPTGLLMFTNYSILQWGQILMPEALLIFFISLFFFVIFNFKYHHPFISFISLITLLILGFIKPFYLSFSFICLLFTFFAQKKKRVLVLWQVLLTIFIVSAYMLWNKNTNSFFGISTSDSTTVFGKIVNFKMENCSAKQNSVFNKRLNTYIEKGGKRDWYQFVYSYKKDGWGENIQTFKKTYEFNADVIRNCPVEYYSKSIPSLWQTLFSYKNYIFTHNIFLQLLSKISYVDYIWSTLFIFALPFIWRKKGLAFVTIFILYNMASIYLFAADSFYRLRVPFQMILYLYLLLFFEKKESKTEEKTA